MVAAEVAMPIESKKIVKLRISLNFLAKNKTITQMAVNTVRLIVSTPFLSSFFFLSLCADFLSSALFSTACFLGVLSFSSFLSSRTFFISTLSLSGLGPCGLFGAYCLIIGIPVTGAVITGLTGAVSIFFIWHRSPNRFG